MSDPADTPASRPDSEDRPAEDAPSQAEAAHAESTSAPEPQAAAPAEQHEPAPAPGPSQAAPVGQPARPGAAAAPPAQHPQPHAYRAAPPQQLTPEERARQAAYYQQLTGPPRMLPPNPRWHRPELSAGQTAVLLTIAVALFGAWAAFHADGVGIGLSLTGIALVAVPLALGDRDDLLPRLPGAVLVASLWTVAAIRDAGWVVALCSIAAFALTPVVLAPQRRFSGNAVMLFFGWLEGPSESFRWARRGRRSREGGAETMRGLWTVLVTVGLLVVFGGLFAAADSTFADMIAGLLPELSPIEIFLRLMLAAVLFPLALVWAYTAVAKPRFDGEGRGPRRTVSRFELAVPLGALNLLFAAFIAVQLRVFVGGADYVQETAGLTPAEYARQGFWQLSFVAFLTLTVIALAAWLAPKRSKEDRWTLRLLLGPLGLMSLAVVASALYRMYTYFETFGLTRLRVWVFTVEIWLGVLFALVLVCCWKLRAAWLPRAVLASGGLALLGLAAANPDALIARYNIDHEHELDLGYLEGLSDDAVPELAKLSGDDRECVLDSFAAERGERDEDGELVERDFMAWNFGYQRAGDVLPEWDGERDYCFDQDVYGYEDYDGDSYEGFVDEERPGESSTTEEPPTAADPPPADPPQAAGFYTVASCDALDLTAADEMFGTGAKGEYGVEPDTDDTVASTTPAEGHSASLTCSYYGIGSSVLYMEVLGWTSDQTAVAAIEAEQASFEDSAIEEYGYEYAVSGIGGETTGFTAVADGPNVTRFHYKLASGTVTVAVAVIDGPTDDRALAVCEDLADQLIAEHAAHL